MNRAFVIVLLAVLIGCTQVVKGRDYEGVILPKSTAPYVLSQCSRETPAKGDSYWLPSPSDIAEMERRLPLFVRDYTRSHYPYYRDIWKRLHAYRRQYVGIVRSGVRTIYVNLFLRDSRISYWKTQPVIVCDGGEGFFGMEYDILKKEFIHLRFNGVA